MNPDPKKFYNERMPEKLGGDYEYARWHSNDFQEAQYGMMVQVMRRLVIPGAARAKTVLEIGPGPGTWTKFLFEGNKGAHYTLLDISAEMLSRAKANLSGGLSVSFAETDFLAYAPAETFDFIFSSRAIEYMPDKPAVAAKLASLLAPGGRAAVITKIPKAFLDAVAGRKLSELHGGQIAPGAFASLLAKNGLRIAAVRMATATVPGLQSPALNRMAFRLFSKLPLVWPVTIFTESYIIVAKKI